MPTEPDADTLLAAALRQPAEARAGFLEAACRDHPELRAKIEALLRESDDVDPFLRAGGALDGPLRDDLLKRLSGGIVPNASEQNMGLHPPASLSGLLGDRFDLLAEIGRGGMGIVYRARDRETGELVALKILKPEIASDAAALERFRNELRLARQITHRNVCRTYELHRFGETAAIAMEYVEGESLRTVLSRYGAVSVRTGIEWTRQICAALREAHARHIVHRDLKPANVLIAQDGRVKVSDFGIARSVRSDATQTGTITGTPAYMSPEQAQGKAVDHRSDIYSLGLLLYEMFTGRQAFQGDTPIAVAMKHIHESPPSPRLIEPDLPERIERAILKCLEKNPASRFQSVDDLESALSKKARAEPASVEGVEVSLPVHLARWQPSDWLLVCLTTVGLLSFFLLFGRTNLVPRSQVHFDRSILSRIAQEYAERLRAPIARETAIGGSSSWDEYELVASRRGAHTALAAATERFPYLLWHVEWEDQQGGRARIDVDHLGSLWAFSRDFPQGAAVEKLSADEARPLAERALQEFFKRDPSELSLETAVAATWGEHQANRFVWTERGESHDLKPRYVAVLGGRDIAALDRRPQLPAGYARRKYGQPSSWKYDTVPALVLLLTILGVTQRSRVQIGTRWRKMIVALTFALGAWFGSGGGESLSSKWIFGSAFGLLLGVTTLFVSVAVEHGIRKHAPAKLSSFAQLFGQKVPMEASGLAIVRGTLLGVALLGVETALIWLGTSRWGMWLDEIGVVGRGWELITPSRHVYMMGRAIGETLLTGFVLVPVAIYVTSRLVSRVWLAVLLAAVLGAASDFHFTMAAVQPNLFKIAFLFLTYLALAWVFVRFDLLTLLWTVFTYSLWWQNYRLLVVREPIGTTGEWIVFAVWGAIVAAFATAAFRSPLRAAYQRVAAAFE
jgi:serine/threonine protein kinase